MSKRYRQLLPIPDSDGVASNSHPSGPTSTSGSSSSEPFKRQRIGTQIACNTCRKRKIRCDGKRPHCEACRQRGVQELCVYVESHIQGQTSKETDQILDLFDVMKSGPESQAIHILRVLRCHSDLDTIFSIIRPRISLTPHISSQQQTRGPTRHLGLESELMARHSLSFPALQPLESSILKAVLSTGRISATDSENAGSPIDFESNPFQTHHPRQYPTPILHPCDERLEKLNISFWTTVPIPSDLAAKIILLYLETDHPLLGTFDPDLFVNDLINCETRFCSRFLLSAVMYWGCQMYSALDPTVKEYTPQFSEETEKRWAEDKSKDSLLTLAGIPLLGLAYLGDGKDHYALTYVSEANSMGTRMGFFGTEYTVAMPKVREVNSELQSATSYAAWGTFNWVVLMALFYQQPGLSYPEHPPIWPIPGNGWHETSEGSPESIRQTFQSTYMGDTFPVLCRFWRIIHQVTLRYYRDQPYPREGLSDHITLAFAEYKYRELIAWAETLPPSMVRSEQSPHHVLIFHIWFHVAILSILHPFTVRARDSSRSLRFKTFPCKRSSPDAAYKASINQLKRLIVVYRKNYMSSTYTMLWHTGLIHVANANLGDTKDPAWRFYLFFCIQCYGRLRQAYRFAEAIGRSLLSMALQQGDLPASEARHIMEQYEENQLINPSYDIRATFMADLNLAMTNPSEASVESLADRFEDIAIFQEFTNAGGSSEDEQIESDDNSWDTP
ncbi:Nitrogen assimilation transcription factor nit-4 [Fusarium oxysporum f. sp. raphani]|uniref:Nitrogen assimilation transcription factor nit-4 n=1 Tax=Fusarium oxysporum f. sp. raphani TaxID=96318 RepID=A0A8J5PAF4_FUSOX|nr:Nitrogen assimilation transcription factor nit-4 [Fusarium oxysporum f. sp. conglutinans]KAG7416649.1 Nitrogen assimilation transcription factor nit-4 [Fusarium oxysporum f. sp. raphani]KAI8406631.1 hypothetical protein FOFC_14101 [Fusarium oxysporum]